MEEKPLVDELFEPIPGEYGHSIPRELMNRELGASGPFSRHSTGRNVVSQTLATKAVHTMCTKESLKKRSFKLPAGARTTFHMAFSPDGTKVASCHGDHNVYISEVGTGKVVQTLTGHPRTPWCVTFHPTQNDVLASGCLAGHVRVWDLNGGSETLLTDSGTVIASLAFHPTVRLLAVATFNEIIFWDWGLPYPLSRCSTENTKEKVRLVRFDRLGRNLITGITNFPRPPLSEEPELMSRSEKNAFFRPNILRNIYHPPGTASRPVPQSSSRRDITPIPREPEADDPDEVGSAAAESVAIAVALATEDEDPDISDELHDRQERFQQSYRQLVNHYQDLVSHYQQFLRSRIPRLIETSQGIREPSDPVLIAHDPFMPLSDTSTDTSPDTSNDATPPIDIILSTNPSVESVESILEPIILETVVPDEVSIPMPIPMVIDDEVPGPSRLMHLAHVASLDSEVTSTTNAEVPVGNVADSTTNPAPPRSANDLQSIEALAQNILEMQNLCTQARRDAPLTIETQHIIELQNIRRHLEVLQEQTRDLQSSIRQTLTNLARGSFDALRSRIVSEMAASELPDPRLLAPPNPTGLRISAIRERIMDVARRAAAVAADDDHPLPNTSVPLFSEPVPPPIHHGPRPPVPDPRAPAGESVNTNRTLQSNPSPGPYMFSNAPSASRSRVPPVLTMHYDIGEGYYRTRITTNTNNNNNEGPGTSNSNNNPNNEPVQGSSREQNSARNDPYRRMFREYHIMGDRNMGEAEHSRFCPFSGRDGSIPRPAPRMRCLTDMGIEPVLSVWPSSETGQLTLTRSFRSLTESLTPQPSSSQAGPSGAQAGGPPDRNNNTEPHINFPAYGNLMNGGPHWINNDVGVGVYLTVRQFNDRVNNLRMERDFLRAERDELLLRRARVTSALANSAPASLPVDINSEDWQRHFNAGLGLVPPSVREGQRQSSRRRSRNNVHSEGNLVYTLRHGYARPIPLRPSPWDEFRTNISSSQSGQDPGTFGPAPRSVTGPNTREVPPVLGGFRRGYSMRVGDDYIPVYSHLAMTSPTTNSAGIPDEVRESPQTNVYTFPIGLFLEGSGWLGGVQSIGIYWPPVSREEEESLAEFRRTENLVPFYTEDSESVMDYPRYRIEYDQSQLRILLPNDLTLTFIQPGLTLLDAVTTVSNWPRPRPASGTVYISQLAPFLDAVERLFSHRMRRGVVGGSSSGVRLSGALQPGPFSRHYSIRARRTPNGSGTSVPWNPDDPNQERQDHVQIETVNAEMFSRQLQRIHRMERLERLDRAQQHSSGDRAPTYDPASLHRYHHMRVMQSADSHNSVLANSQAVPITTADNPQFPPGPPIQRHSGEPFETYRRRVYHAYVNDMMMDRDRERHAQQRSGLQFGRSSERPESSRNTIATEASQPAESLSDNSNSGSNGGDSSSLASTRRVIRLAVDTATSEVLRSHHSEILRAQQAAAGRDPPYTPEFGGDYPTRHNSIARAIESRIERVLNERGNRGMGTGPPSLYSPGEVYLNPRRSASSSRSPMEARPYLNPRDPRLRDTRLMRWSAGTQTVQSFLESTSSSSSSSDSEATRSTAQGLGLNPTLPIPGPDPEESIVAVVPEPESIAEEMIIVVPDPGPIPEMGLSDAGGSGRPLSRRRSYSRISLNNSNAGDEAEAEAQSDEEIPNRIPRLQTLASRGAVTPNAPTTRTLSAAERRRRPAPGGSSGPGPMPNERLSERHIRVFNSPYGDQQIIIRRRRGGDRYLQATTNERRFTSFSTLDLTPSSSARTRPEGSRAAGTSNTSPTPGPAEESNPPSSMSGTRVRVNVNRLLAQPRPYPPTINLGMNYIYTHGAGPVLASPRRFHSSRNIPDPETPTQPDPNPPEMSYNYVDEMGPMAEAAVRFHSSTYNPNPRARPPTYYTMDAATTAFLSSRIQKWDFSQFEIPDISKREECLVVRECSLHSDACLDVSKDSDFMAVLQPSENGSYSAVGIYSLRDESLGDIMYLYHFDQNTVSVSISPSCDYIVVGYAGRGPLYRFVHPSRNIGQILSLTRDGDRVKLVTVKELFADSQSSLMSINCMHWVPVAGYGIIYGTNTGELVLLTV